MVTGLAVLPLPLELCCCAVKVLQREAINKNISDLMSGHSVEKQLLLLVLTSIMNVSLAFVFTNII